MLREVKKIITHSGYEEVYPLIFKLKCTKNDVEKLLFVRKTYGKKGAIEIWFGFRNVEAQNFSDNLMPRFIPALLHPLLRRPPQGRCSMEFSLGRLTEWSYRHYLSLSDNSLDEILEKITTGIKSVLIPIHCSIETNIDFLNFLNSNNSWGGWNYINASIRAAQIVFMSCYIYGEYNIDLSSIKNHEKEILLSMNNSVKLDDFINFCVIECANYKNFSLS